MQVTNGFYRHIGPGQKFCSIETLHSWMKGNGAKFSKDRLCDVLRQIRNFNRRERDQVYRDMGLVKVKGGYGGTYWE